MNANWKFACALACCVALQAARATPVVLFHDDFNGNALDTGAWYQPTGPGSFLGRTQVRPPSLPPAVSGGVVTLRLDTFNPSALVPGDSFYGTEIRTKQAFSVGEGLSFEARVRLVDPVPPGLVGSWFTYETNGSVRDELTFELLSNDVAAGRSRVLTNAYNNGDFSQPGDRAFADVPGLDLTQFNVFRIDWLPNEVRWLVNGQVVREESTTVPDQAMQAQINFWAPDSFFTDAFDASLQPAADASANQTYLYQVDYVTVSSLSQPVPAPPTPWLVGMALAVLAGMHRLRRRGFV